MKEKNKLIKLERIGMAGAMLAGLGVNCGAELMHANSNNVVHAMHIPKHGHTGLQGTLIGTLDPTFGVSVGVSNMPTQAENTNTESKPHEWPTHGHQGQQGPHIGVAAPVYGGIIFNTSGSTKQTINPTDTTRQFVRKIYVKLPGQDKQLVSTDKLTFSRGYTTDEVTGQVTYEDWNKQNTEDFQAPTFAGYTPDKTKIQGKTLDPNKSDFQSEEDDVITYTANSQSMHINFVDANGKQLASQTVSGITGQTVDISKDSLKIPTNYRIADGASYPTKITFGATPAKDYTVQVVPDTTPDGIEKKDVKRTINLHFPNGQTETVVQTVRFTRTKTINDTTGETEYGNWSDITKYPEYDVPSVAGLTPDKASVNSQAVSATDSDSTVDVNYTANKQSVKINFVDKQGKTIGSQTVNGETGKAVKVNLQVPQGYQVQGGQQIPNLITFGAKPLDDLTVKVETDAEANTDTHVKTDAEKYVPAARNFNLQVGDQLPDATNAITNLSDLPKGTSVKWTSKPDMQKPGEYVVHVAVTYPDGSLTSVDVPIKLSAPKSVNNNPKIDGNSNPDKTNKDQDIQDQGTNKDFNKDAPSTDEADKANESDKVNTSNAGEQTNAKSITIGTDSDSYAKKNNTNDNPELPEATHEKQNTEPEQKLPETAENKSGLAMAGLGVASLISLVGIAGAKVKKHHG